MEFRFYSYDVTGGGSNSGVRFDDISLNGETIAILETSSVVMVAVAGCALLRRHRN